MSWLNVWSKCSLMKKQRIPLQCNRTEAIRLLWTCLKPFESKTIDQLNFHEKPHQGQAYVWVLVIKNQNKIITQLLNLKFRSISIKLSLRILTIKKKSSFDICYSICKQIIEYLFVRDDISISLLATKIQIPLIIEFLGLNIIRKFTL